MRKQLFAGTLGLAALILNPFYACISSKPEFKYSAAEMKAAVEGTWLLTLEDQSYIFHIKQGDRDPKQQHSSRSLIPSAHACGNRTLVASAGACINTSFMPVIVEVTGQTDDGMFMVEGTTFRDGLLTIKVADHQIQAKVAPDGRATIENKYLNGKLVRTAR